MTLHRFYIPLSAWNETAPVLDEGESRHASAVLRLREGDLVSVFDGRGTEIRAVIAHAGKREIRLEPREILRTPPLPARLVLAQAVPKGKNLDLVLQKACELGASEIIPLITERTVVRPEPAEAAEKQEKWQRVVIEACKQCGRNHVPQVREPVSFAAFVRDLPETELALIAALEPGAAALHDILSVLPGRPRSALVLIGPEGDFTPVEVAAAKAAGCRPLTLGPVILRTETAAVYALSVLGHELFRD